MNNRFAQIALSLEGTVEVPHGQRRAFRRRVIYATLSPDEAAANVKLLPEQQQQWCAVLGEAMRPVPNKWGLQGWTELRLSALPDDMMEPLLHMAWAGAGKAGTPRR